MISEMVKADQRIIRAHDLHRREFLKILDLHCLQVDVLRPRSIIQNGVNNHTRTDRSQSYFFHDFAASIASFRISNTLITSSSLT